MRKDLTTSLLSGEGVEGLCLLDRSKPMGKRGEEGGFSLFLFFFFPFIIIG